MQPEQQAVHACCALACVAAVSVRSVQKHDSCCALQATLFHDLGMTKADFTKLVTSRRDNGLLQLRVPTIRNKLHFLKDEIGLNNVEVRKLLVKCPRILEHKLESTMRPHLEFLHSHGISKEDIPKVSFSCLLGCMDLSQLMPSSSWLNDPAGQVVHWLWHFRHLRNIQYATR